jgi:hypothetical protein
MPALLAAPATSRHIPATAPRSAARRGPARLQRSAPQRRPWQDLHKQDLNKIASCRFPLDVALSAAQVAAVCASLFEQLGSDDSHFKAQPLIFLLS